MSTSVSQRDCQGLQEKFGKAEQDCFGSPGTDWDFSQSWGLEVQ